MFKILHKATRFLHFCRTVKIFHLATSEQKFRIVVILNFAHFGHQYTETSIIRCKNWTPFWILSLLQTYYYFVSDHDFSWILEFLNNQFDGSSDWRIVTIGYSKKSLYWKSFKWLKKLHTSTPKLDQWLHRKFQLDTRTVTHLIWSLMESSSTEFKKKNTIGWATGFEKIWKFVSVACSRFSIDLAFVKVLSYFLKRQVLIQSCYIFDHLPHLTKNKNFNSSYEHSQSLKVILVTESAWKYRQDFAMYFWSHGMCESLRL